MSQYNNNKQRAAALRCSEAENHAPVVMAAGVDYTASKIIEVTQESNTPVFQNDALTSLLSQINMSAEVPSELYQAVADLYLYFLNYGELQAPPAALDTLKVPSAPEMSGFSEGWSISAPLFLRILFTFSFVWPIQ